MPKGYLLNLGSAKQNLEQASEKDFIIQVQTILSSESSKINFF